MRHSGRQNVRQPPLLPPRFLLRTLVWGIEKKRPDDMYVICGGLGGCSEAACLSADGRHSAVAANNAHSVRSEIPPLGENQVARGRTRGAERDRRASSLVARFWLRHLTDAIATSAACQPFPDRVGEESAHTLVTRESFCTRLSSRSPCLMVA